MDLHMARIGGYKDAASILSDVEGQRYHAAKYVTHMTLLDVIYDREMGNEASFPRRRFPSHLPSAQKTCIGLT